jgi:hypothetical protein
MIEVKDGSVHCERCGKVVAAKEKPGDKNKAQRPDVLIGQCGHVIAERSDKYSPWEIVS